MNTDLETEIKSLVETLTNDGKTSLANCIEKNWGKSALAYSKELNTWGPENIQGKMEPEMLAAFGMELDRLETPAELKKNILASLEKRRILQTGPHLGVTMSPRFLCINWLESLGLPKEDFDVVTMYSGVPFSNASRPGRINKKEGSVNLFPSNMQDALVYKSLIPDKLVETVQNLPKELHSLRALFPRAVMGGSYTKWALKGCENIEKRALGRDNLVYLDVNEIVTNYLLQVLENRDHIIYKIFFDPHVQDEFVKVFPDEIMFYAPIMDGKFESLDNLIIRGGKLKGKKKDIILVDPKVLIKEIRDGRLCPGMLTGFLALAFINKFKCFGSFAQVEYLPVYQEKLSKLKFMHSFGIEKVPTANLTTGSFPGHTDLFPADAVMEGKVISPSENILFGELLIPMKKLILDSYFVGDKRINDKK